MPFLSFLPRRGAGALRLAAPLALLLALLASAPADAASKRKIAAVGDAVPGGGQFAGPGFGRTPDGAGSGWFTFRATVADGNTTEQIVLLNARTGQREAVAVLGQTIDDTIGRIKQFLGRPTVNANGDVAFVAVMTPPEDRPAALTDPTPAALFLRRNGVLSVVATSPQETDLGLLDLVSPVDLFTYDGSSTDIVERTPGLGEDGTVAFVASTVETTGAPRSSGLFVKPAGGAITPLVEVGKPFAGGTVEVVGPPVVSGPANDITFRLFLDVTTDFVDAIVRLSGGTLTTLVQAPFTVKILPFVGNEEQDVLELGSVIDVAPDGTLAFTGGPLIDFSGTTSDLQPGVFVLPAGAAKPVLVSYPGQRIRNPNDPTDILGVVTSFALSADFGGRLSPPSVTSFLDTTGPEPVWEPSVVFFASLNFGASEMILRAAADGSWVPRRVIRFGAQQGDASPLGGTYLQASAEPATDQDGVVVFSARLAGANSSEALAWKTADGAGTDPIEGALVIGDPIAGSGDGFFGGPPFFPPQLNDRGDVVFKSYVTRGPGLGIFRAPGDGGALEAIVRVGDAAPTESPGTFVDFPGDPAIDDAGNVAFAGSVTGRGRGVFVAGPDGIREIAIQKKLFDDALRTGATFEVVAPNPAIRADGTVIFRATITYPDPLGSGSIREDGLFAADAAGLHLLAAEGDPSGTGLSFFRFRDPSAGGTNVAFRAPLGTDDAIRNGLFVLDDTTLVPAAVEGQTLADGVTKITALTGRPGVAASGRVASLGRVVGGGHSGQGVLAGPPGGMMPLAVAGDPGPAGGIYRSFGRPAVASNGDVAFRASFEPFQGGVTGIFVASPNGAPVPVLQVGENAPSEIGGRIAGINQNVSLNASDEVAAIASIAGGDARSAIILASRATLAVPALRIQIAKPSTDVLAPSRDRLRLRLALTPGATTDALARTKRPVTITVADATRTLWSATVPGSAFAGGGRRFKLRTKKDAPGSLTALAVQIGKRGARVAAAASGLDLTLLGNLPLQPPFTIRLEIGDDSAVAIVPCKAKGRTFACRS